MDESRIEKCRYCGGLEYWSEKRWLNGKCLCRDCYKKAYREANGREYEWPDLDGPRPTLQEYIQQRQGGRRMVGTRIKTAPDGRKFSISICGATWPEWGGVSVFPAMASNPDYSGKWIVGGIEEKAAIKLCAKAVYSGAVQEAKFSVAKKDAPAKSVCCFYLDGTNIQAHREILSFLKGEGVLPMNKGGTYRNISFKYDSQTRAKEYGKNFVPRIQLSDFINLETGEWIHREE